MTKKYVLSIFILIALTFHAFAQPIDKIQNLDINKLSSLINSTDQATPHIISFWASWCKPCMEELPYFEKIKQIHPEIIIDLINLDFEKDVKSKVFPIIAKRYNGIQIHRLPGISADDWMPLVNVDWDGAIPATLIIMGNTKSFKNGKFKDFEELKATLSKL